MWDKNHGTSKQRGRLVQTFLGRCKSCSFSRPSMALDPESNVYGEVPPSSTVVLSWRMMEVGGTEGACAPPPMVACHHTLALPGSETWHTVGAGTKLSLVRDGWQMVLQKRLVALMKVCPCWWAHSLVTLCHSMWCLRASFLKLVVVVEVGE